MWRSFDQCDKDDSVHERSGWASTVPKHDIVGEYRTKTVMSMSQPIYLENGIDEVGQISTKIDQSCAKVQWHHFRYFREQPTCLNVVALEDQSPSYQNIFDE